MPDDTNLLRRIDRYLDAVPRTSARTEVVGPFTLFVTDGPGWPFYARPTPGALTFSTDDVAAVRERQRALTQPEEIEWIVEVTPEVGPVASSAGMRVTEHPLMHLPRGAFVRSGVPTGVRVRIAAADDDVATIHAVAALGFGAPGPSAGASSPEVVREAAARVDDGMVGFTRARIERGLTVTAVATAADRVVAVGSHNPLGGTSEIVGVATLPAFRHRGIGTALTSALVLDAFGRSISTVFLSAGDERIARVYARLGFRTIGAAGLAEPRVG
jgi:predicted GNAT family acetyltransferase